MRYVIYCRKSQESEDRQVLSIDSQKQELYEKFEGREDVEIVGRFVESKSAKAPGRPEFNRMMEMIHAGKADGIISWHPDRLSRNSVDAGQIIYTLDTGVLNDLKFATYTFENSPEGKFMLAILLGHSKYYSDALSKNIKRGNREKLRRGWRPNAAPTGYLNCQETKTIITDPKRFPIIQQLFSLMATGCYTPKMLYEKARDEYGLRTIQKKRIGGKPVSLSGIYRILGNPFYCGLIAWNGEIYKGKHEPSVSMADFENIQKTLHRRTLKPRSHKPGLRFAYTGLLTCGECECAITAEKKVNRFGSHYVYYHCTHRKTGYTCKQGSVELRQLETQFMGFLDGVSVDKELHDKLLAYVEKEKKSFKTNHDINIASLEAAYAKSQKQLESLVDMRMNSLIDDDVFKKRKSRLQFEQEKLTQELQKRRADDEWFEPFKDALELRYRAKNWFASGDLEVKRLMMKTLGSNPLIMDRKLSIQAAKPFFAIQKSSDFRNLRRVVKEFRKLYDNFDNHSTFVTLREVKKLVKTSAGDFVGDSSSKNSQPQNVSVRAD